MPRRQVFFPTVTSDGGLLPSSLLTRIAQNDATTGGLSPSDYHLNPDERLGEMVNRSWNRAMGAWAAFQEAVGRIAVEDPATTVTRERWLLVLFEELGFGRLQPSRSLQVDGRQFPISHEWGDRVPIHLVGARIDLNRPTPGVAGAARSSPHSLVQEFLNRSPDHLWGIVSNGLQLRLLRDNASVTRQAYVAFDLAGMMDGQVYPDFVLLWLLVHESRFEGESPSDCWLEKWAKEAEAAGSRALARLRDGVEAAITVLGAGFLAHPANAPLREALRSGAIPTQEFYREVLRLVYRLIFLFAAEDRGLLLIPDSSPDAATLYRRFYSMDRLRLLAERRRGTAHSDLYRSLKVTMTALSDHGSPALGLPALGGFLWSAPAQLHLTDAELSNRVFLGAVHALAFHAEDGKTKPTDYRNLGSEELGSVYESLLELHPELNVDAGAFALGTAGGHERRSTGSYYTPSGLIGSLLDSALAPVLDAAAAGSDAEAAILRLRVVDPACGSGHFLVAAAHRIAKRLATVRTGDDEPSPPETRRALRDVIGNCIYGVDANEMAVELCKVGLWMEAMEPGRPLSFLDHHVRLGNSLIGGTVALVDAGIPDSAFRLIEGDDRVVVSSLRRRNRAEREGQASFLFDRPTPPVRAAALAGPLDELNRIDDLSMEGVQDKERRFREFVVSPAAINAKAIADTWCAAFVAPKTDEAPAITEDVRARMATDPSSVPTPLRHVVETLAEDFRFFHWEIEFADVFAKGGFDVVLGNPPWEQLELEEQEFFAARAPHIAGAAGARRKRLIADLEEGDALLFRAYRSAQRKIDAQTHFLRSSERFPLCGQGRINSYSVFAETMRDIINPTGRVGVIVPSGIATDDTTKEFFASLTERRSLVSLYDFENQAPLFPAVHRSYKFCLLTLTGSSTPAPAAEFVFFAHRLEDLGDVDRRFRLTPQDFQLLNPNTRTCPIFRTRRDAEITRGIYERLPILVNRTEPQGNPWEVSFSQGLFNMSADSELFCTAGQLESDGWTLHGNVFDREGKRYLPLYEGKMFHQFDHRFATFLPSGQTEDITDSAKADFEAVPQPRYWVSERDVADRNPPGTPWLFAWRNIARTTDERTMIAAALPAVGAGHSAQLLTSSRSRQVLLGLFDSFAFDFVVRQKLGGINMTFFTIEQLPVPEPGKFDIECLWDPESTLATWITSRVRELSVTAKDLSGFAVPDSQYRWDPARRDLLRAELDAAFFHVYALTREDAGYVMDSFPIVMRRDLHAHGEYRTKRLVLERFDALAAASGAKDRYCSVLSPPPGSEPAGLQG